MGLTPLSKTIGVVRSLGPVAGQIRKVGRSGRELDGYQAAKEVTAALSIHASHGYHQ